MAATLVPDRVTGGGSIVFDVAGTIRLRRSADERDGARVTNRTGNGRVPRLVLVPDAFLAAVPRTPAFLMNHGSTTPASRPPCALAIFAHPDDIEYFAGGTLLLLRHLGWETHYLNVSNGDKGSTVHRREELALMRAEEARHAAAILGAVHHPSLATDMLLFYEEPLLRKVAAVVRRVRPRIVLTHAPQDYMEDHMNVSRLAVTAAFVRGMPNFDSDPPEPVSEDDVVIYHAMPHGLRDPLRRPVEPDLFVDTSSVLETQRRALAAHASQQAWLDASQGAADFVDVLGTMSRAVGKMSGVFQHAEGWRRHLHLGYSAHDDDDPLAAALGDHCRENPRAQSTAALEP